MALPLPLAAVAAATAAAAARLPSAATAAAAAVTEAAMGGGWSSRSRLEQRGSLSRVALLHCWRSMEPSWSECGSRLKCVGGSECEADDACTVWLVTSHEELKDLSDLSLPPRLPQSVSMDLKTKQRALCWLSKRWAQEGTREPKAKGVGDRRDTFC